MPQVAVVIPAYNEADRVGATVAAAAKLSDVDVIVVVDDGSRDGTAGVARQAGASVLRHARNRGKAAAMETGAEAVRLLDQREPRDVPRHLLFLDADLEATAAEAGPLITPVAAGEADMSIAVFTALVKLGGHGLVAGPAAERPALPHASRLRRRPPARQGVRRRDRHDHRPEAQGPADH